METKQRSSFDDYSSAASSAIRRMTHSSTHRLSLRRTSSPSHSTNAFVPPTNETPVSCVSRETVSNECGLHRFIVWVAIKRNACRRMTPEERRECPLLRCRKRFANHELMLQHLYTCNQLATGEYWCYDCEKVERFNDAKCRQCLGHPSKRRKIMSMARNFFGSLGNKPRNSQVVDLDLEVDDVPPSYSSVVEPSEPSQPELSSNEIHEMSSEAEPPESADIAPSEAISALQIEIEPVAQSAPSPAPQIAAPIPVSPVELDSASIEDALINWEPALTPPPVVISGASPQQIRTKSPDRPVLQLHTHDLGHYRVKKSHSKTSRSKVLGPSSSVRSTCSTASNNSTMSTASYEVTPMSAWSGTWARGQGFDSTLTSPDDDLINMDDLVPTGALAGMDKLGSIKEKDANHDDLDNLLAELPADLPMLSPFPTTNFLFSSLDTDQSVFSFDATVPTELSIETNLALTESSNVSLNLTELLAQPTWNHYVSAHSLVESARDTLHMHLAESVSKLKQLNNSRLANELRQMPPDAVALAGLRAMNSVLEGNIILSSVDILCFVHLVYSLSVVIHEQDAPSRWKEFFMQAMSYASWVPQQEMGEFFHLVQCLWRPHGIDNTELNMFMQTIASDGSQAASMSEKMKGKQPQANVPATGLDAFVSVSQIFLDELEYSALQEVRRPHIQASDLSIQHMKDVNHQEAPNSPFAVTIMYILRNLCQQYSGAPGYVTALKELLDRVGSSYITLRRLELELMHAGRTYLSPGIFFGHYITTVRAQIDSLHAQTETQFTPRLGYHQQGIRLMESMIQGPVLPPTMWENLTAAPANPSYDSLDQYFGSITPGTSGTIGLDPMTSAGHAVLGNASVAVEDVSMDVPTLSSAQYLLNPDGASSAGPSAAATSPPSPAPGSSPAKLVEADSCCEICGYRPKGDPRWFPGSMAKHKKLQHATSPPKIYRCPFPGCTSQYKNRPDNLRQHQIDKGHFVEGQDDASRRPGKRKRMK